MREIKFRAWNEELKRMAYSTDEHFKTLGWWGTVILDKEYLGEQVMQYTGLKDKNGKEIYEGDIVIHHGHRQKAIVEWNEKRCSFHFKYFDDVTDAIYKIDSDLFEIIGNIYENPNLLQ